MSSLRDRSQTGRTQRLKQKAAAAFYNANPTTAAKNLDPSTLLLVKGGRQTLTDYEKGEVITIDEGCCPLPPPPPCVPTLYPFTASPVPAAGFREFAGGCAYANGLWVAVGLNGTTGNNILYSTNPAVGWSISPGTPFGIGTGGNGGNAVAYGNGLWVAVGFDRTNTGKNILYSTNPSVGWSISPGTPFDTTGGGIGIAYNGNGLWVATGLAEISGKAILYSTNPATGWTASPGQPTDIWRVGVCVAYANGLWVAGTCYGNTSSIVYSTNPTVGWTASPGEPFGPIGSYPIGSDRGCFGVAFGNGCWVAVGRNVDNPNKSILYSTDPTIGWVEATDLLFNIRGDGVAYGNGRWIAVGDDTSGNTILTSTSPSGGWVPAGTQYGQGYGIAYGNGLWVAAGAYGTGNNKTILYAEDSCPRPPPSPPPPPPQVCGLTPFTTAQGNLFSRSNAANIVYGNGLWVALGADSPSRILYATDPSGTWTESPVAIITGGYAGTDILTYGDGYWVAVTNENDTGGIWYTTDPTSDPWTYLALPIRIARNIKFGGNLWVVSGQTVDGFRSIICSTSLILGWAPSPDSPYDKGYGFAIGYGNGVWIASDNFLGSDQYLYSTDPTQGWTSPGSLLNGLNTSKIIYANGIWVAGGYGANNILYTTDPSGEWLAAPGQPFGQGQCRSIAYGNGRWIAVGYWQDSASNYTGYNILYTTDPSNGWVAVDGVYFGYDDGGGYDIAYNCGTWVVGGSSETNNTILCATDTCFSCATPTQFFASPGQPFGTGVASGRGIAYGNGKWVAVGLGDGSRYGYNIFFTNDPSLPWTIANSPFIGVKYGIAYGNGLWVAVGNATGTESRANILYTTDPSLPWSASPGSPFGTGCGFGITYGNGTWVAVGTNYAGITILYTTDPSQPWNVSPGQPFGTGCGFGITYGNGIWVAVGGDTTGAGNSILYTTDPSQPWTASPGQPFGTTGVGRSIAYGNGLWVAVGNSGVTENNIVYTTDPSLPWTVSPGQPFGASGSYGIAYGNGLWVAVGGDTTGAGNSILYTTDPSQPWTASPGQQFTGLGYGIAYANETWVAVGYGSENTILYSQTCCNLCPPQLSQFAAAPAQPFGTTGTVYSIVYGNGLWLTRGYTNSTTIKHLYATDPSGTWIETPVTIPYEEFSNTSLASKLTFGDGYWVTLTNENNTGGIWYTTNPISVPWAYLALPIRTASTITFGDNLWVVSGINSSNLNIILYSTTLILDWDLTPDSPFGQGNGFNIGYGNGVWVAIDSSFSGQYLYSTDPTQGWTSSVSPLTNLDCYNIGYVNGFWVAVGYGSGNNILYTTDPSGEWIVSPGEPFGGFGYCAAIVYANGLWIAVGEGRNPNNIRTGFNMLQTKDIKRGWMPVYGPQFGTGGAGFDIANVNGLWVAVGEAGGTEIGNNILYVTDICPRPPPCRLTPFVASPGQPFGANGNGLDVAYGNGKWVAVGDGVVGNIVYTTDLSQPWTIASQRFGARGSGRGIAYANGLWVAVGFDDTGSGNNIVYTTDPSLPWNASPGQPFGIRSGFGVAYGNGLWVAVGFDDTVSRNTIIYTTDPSLPWIASPGQPFGASGTGYGIAYGNGMWVAVGGNGAVNNILYTTDPSQPWTASPGQPFGTGYGIGIAYRNGIWVAVGFDDTGSGNNILYTTDPSLLWNTSPGQLYGTSSIAYGNGTWVAVSGRNILYTTDPSQLWTVSPGQQFTGIGHGIAYANGTWVAVGYDYAQGNTILYAIDSCFTPPP